MKLDFDAEATASLANSDPKRRRGRPPGPVQKKKREQLALAGVELDDPDRPTEGRKRKAPTSGIPEKLRDGPNQPLAWPAYEIFAHHVAGGNDERLAWRMAGYSSNNYGYLKLVRDPVFLERVGELRQRYQQRAGIGPGYLEARLMALAHSDVADFIEPVPHSSRFRTKDILSLPPEVRAAISEFSIDPKTGRVNVRLHDKAKILADLLRMNSAQKVEMTGRDGGPVQVDALVQNVGNLCDEDLAHLQEIAARAAGIAPAESEKTADDGDDGNE